MGGWIVLALLVGAAPAAPGQTPVEVTLDGEAVLAVQAGFGSYTSRDRALVVSQRILRFAKSGRPLNEIRIVEADDALQVRSAEELLIGVTEADVQATGKSRRQLADSYAARIRDAVGKYREKRHWRTLLTAGGLAALSAAVFAGILYGLVRIRRKLRVVRRAWVIRKRAIRFHESELVTAERLGAILGVLERVVFWVAVAFLAELFVPLVLGFFPGTAGWSATLFGWILTPIRTLGIGLAAYLPNLFFLVVIAIAAHYLIRLARFVFSEVREGRIRVSGFFPDWADPTFKLSRILILILAVVVAYPYLPGAESPAFRGISIFLGLLLSLGSSSAVANAVAGTILTYMRAFHVGDRVKIGETVGDVIEKTLLVTRVRTIKNVVVTIPNSAVLSGHVLNYTTAARESALILHTSVTIGYDAPWRTVHQLLIDAASATSGILAEPRPFVLQTALNDFFVTYELNAYTADAARMVGIYSDLHQNIQDKFNEAGVEIMSPHYTSLRDGNAIAIPETYRPQDYRAPGFQVRSDARASGRTASAGEG